MKRGRAIGARQREVQHQIHVALLQLIEDIDPEESNIVSMDQRRHHPVCEEEMVQEAEPLVSENIASPMPSDEPIAVSDSTLHRMDQLIISNVSYGDILLSRFNGDWLACFFYNKSDAFWRYNELAFIRNMVLEWIKYCVPVPENIDSHALTSIERRTIDEITYPENWDTSPHESWEEYTTRHKQRSASEYHDWHPASPSSYKGMEEDLFVLAVITGTSYGRNWFLQNGDNNPPKANYAGVQRFLFSREDNGFGGARNGINALIEGNDPHGTDADGGIERFLTNAWVAYEPVFSSVADSACPTAQQMDLLTPPPFSPGQIPEDSLPDDIQ